MKEIIITPLASCILVISLIIFVEFKNKLGKFKNRLDKIEDDIYPQYKPWKEGDPISFGVNKLECFKLLNERINELEKKITEPKYQELLEYLDKNKMEVEYVTITKFTCQKLHMYYSCVYFNNKNINLHPDQTESLFNKAKQYYEAKELLGVKKEVKTTKKGKK